MQLIAYIKNPDITFEELSEIVTGPDFPTGGSVQGDMLELYKTGRGRLIMRGKTTYRNTKEKRCGCNNRNSLYVKQDHTC